MILADPGLPGSLLGALGPLMGPLGVVLGRSWRLLSRSWAILGRSFGILRRSWVALGGSWFALGDSWLAPGRSRRAKRARRAAGQGACVARGKPSKPPPSEIANLDPHPSRLYSTFRGQRNEERGTMELKNRRMQSIVRDDGCMVESIVRDDGRSDRRGMFRTPRGPGGRRISDCF